jgi:2-(1,2-epoxy-1,2-dihydrophenyl)acetyl-CoA isomerase
MDTWNEDVSVIAARLAAMPTKAIGIIKRSLKATTSMSFDDYLEQEAQGQRLAGLTIDHREGVTAFMEKRKPVYSGQ